MEDEILKCPNCGSTEVTVSHLQRYMANTGEHYCHSVKPHHADSEATCLACLWIGRRDQLVPNARAAHLRGESLSYLNGD